MQVLVIGGAGFIGRALVTDLLQAGHDVWVSSRHPDRTRDASWEGAEAVAWDGASPDGLARILDAMAAAGKGPPAVVNLAGESIAQRWTPAAKERILASRTGSARALAEAARLADAPLAVVVQGSASGFYGSLARGDDESWFDESSPRGSGFLAEVCAAWEAASEPLEALGVRRVLARTTMVLGPGGGALPAMARPFRWFLGGPPGGRQWVSWIHLADEAGAIRFLLETDTVAGPCNLAAPEPATMGRLCRELGRAMGRPSWLPVPETILRLALGEMAREMILSSQRVRPAKLVEAGFEWRMPGLAGAMAAAVAATVS